MLDLQLLLEEDMVSPERKTSASVVVSGPSSFKFGWRAKSTNIFVWKCFGTETIWSDRFALNKYRVSYCRACSTV